MAARLLQAGWIMPNGDRGRPEEIALWLIGRRRKNNFFYAVTRKFLPPYRKKQKGVIFPPCGKITPYCK